MKNLQQHQHISHHHALVPLMLDEGEEFNCNGCDRVIQEPFHGCISCNYFLHDSCLNTQRFLQHPSHPHPLTLLPTPTYPTRFFTCNVCGSKGKFFSLSCAQCECDLHLQCAVLPGTLVIREKNDHVLELIFGSPNEDKANTIFVCDICNKDIDPDQWLYYCVGCDFGVHLDCTMLVKTSSRGKSVVKTDSAKEKQENINNENQGAARLKEEADFQNTVHEIQRKMRGQNTAHKLVLQALDNTSDYVGSSHTKY